MPEKWTSIGKIWERRSKAGKDMLSIVINGVPYIAFRNKYKQEGTQNPDWQVFASKHMDSDNHPPKHREPGDEDAF